MGANIFEKNCNFGNGYYFSFIEKSLFFRFTKSQRFTIIPNVARIQLSGTCCGTIYQKFMYYGDFHDIGLAFNEDLNYPKILSLKLYGCM